MPKGEQAYLLRYQSHPQSLLIAKGLRPQSHLKAKVEGRIQNEEGPREAAQSHPQARCKPLAGHVQATCMGDVLLFTSYLALVLLLFSSGFPRGLWLHP